MRKLIHLIIVILTIISTNLNAQIAVNTSGEAANGSAMLDVSSIEKGILIPRMLKIQRDNNISNPIEGLLIYQTDDVPGFYFYDGSDWVVVGNGATTINNLADGKTGGHSVFLGINSGIVDDGSDNWNTGVGEGVLPVNSSGSYNTVVGDRGMQNNTEGSNNTAVGHKALFSNISGSGNIAIGNDAGYNEIGSNKLYIANSNDATPLIYGEFDNDLFRINGTLDINNAFQFPTADGTSSQVLKTNGSGTLSWADDINTGATNINGLSDSKAGGSSVYLGYEAGNVATLSSMSYNTGVGVGVMFSNTTGTSNVALGDYTSYRNTTGSHNTTLGSYSNSTNTTGNGNVAVGCFANNENQTGSNNTIIGFTAGGVEYSSILNRSGCVFIGNGAGQGHTGDNKLIIENSNSSSPLIYGEFDNDKIRINGNFEVSGTIRIEGGSPGANKVLTSDASGNATWETPTTRGVGLDESGLKIIRGTINADGTILSGSGFSVIKNGTGEYAINFLSLFSGAPTVTTGVIYSNDASTTAIGIYVNSLSNSSCMIETFDLLKGGDAEGTGFTFIAIGLQ